MEQDAMRDWVRRANIILGFKTLDPLAKIMGIDSNKLTKTIGPHPSRGVKSNETARLVKHLKSKGLYDKCPLPGDDESIDDGGPIEIRRIERDTNRGYSRDYYTPDIPGSIPELDVSAGAGEGTVGEFVQININGETQVGHRVIAEWKFPEGYLQNVMKVSPGNSMVMEVRGDSMDPTIRHGDKVIIDLRSNAFSDDGLYLISDGHSAPRLKRLEYVFNSEPPTVKIISDNPSHRDVQVMALAELFIAGRVAGRVAAM